MVAAVRSYRESQYHGDIEYWREPPDMSPASAAKMADVMGLSKGSVDSLQMTATMLSLASKKAIAIYPGPSSLYRGVDMSNADNVRLAGMIGADEGKAKSLGKTMLVRVRDARSDAQRRHAGQLDGRPRRRAGAGLRHHRGVRRQYRTGTDHFRTDHDAVDRRVLICCVQRADVFRPTVCGTGAGTVPVSAGFQQFQ